MAGLASGFLSGFAQGTSERDIVQARRIEAKQRQQMNELKLQDYEAGASLRASQRDLQMQQVEAESTKLRNSQMRDSTYQAFDKYEADGDARHLNNFISTAKKLDPQSVFAQASRVDRLKSVGYEEAISLLRKAGVADPEASYEAADGSYIVATNASGERNLISMPKVYATTGYTNYADSRTLAKIKDQALVDNLISGPRSAETQMIYDIQKETGGTLLEAAQKYRAAKKTTSAGSTLERVAMTIRENNPGMGEEESLREAAVIMKSGGTAAEREAAATAEQTGKTDLEALQDVNARKERSSTRVKLDEVQGVRSNLDELSGGSFLDSDLSDTSMRRRAGPLVTELEALTGRELSTEDKRVARNIRDLTALGAKAGETITDAETGLIDRMLRQVKSYVSNETDTGTEGVAAYETFRNVFRNSLYGASLTNSEISAFNTAMGTLGQQTGPVLAKLNESMRSMKSQLEAIYDMNDEYVAHYYLGKSLEEVDATIEAIEERVDLISKGMPSTSGTRITAQEPTAAVVPPEDIQAKLDQIFGGAK